MKRKTASLLMLAFGMMLLSGCGDKTTVATYYSSDESKQVVEHVPVSCENPKKEEEVPQQSVQHIAVSQTQEVASREDSAPVRVVEHVPVTQNYYQVVENDNSTTVNENITVNENTTVNYKEEENTDVQVHVKYNQNSNDDVNENREVPANLEEEDTDDLETDDLESEDMETDDLESEEDLDSDEDFGEEEITCKGMTIPTPKPTETPTPQTTTAPEVTETPIPQTTTVPEVTETPIPQTTTVPEPTETPIPETTDSASKDTQNAKLATPVLSEWKKIRDSAEETFAISDGVTYQITWDKIAGADGYEVELQSQDSGNDKWISRTVTVNDPSYSESFSHIEMHLKARVRAFRKSGITKEYGDWSQEKQLNYYPVC